MSANVSQKRPEKFEKMGPERVRIPGAPFLDLLMISSFPGETVGLRYISNGNNCSEKELNVRTIVCLVFFFSCYIFTAHNQWLRKVMFSVCLSVHRECTPSPVTGPVQVSCGRAGGLSCECQFHFSCPKCFKIPKFQQIFNRKEIWTNICLVLF